ncbi:hypothetical protein ACFXBB_01410 [Streptomyces scopuliridis]|uniref:hypothetical protein n=1 Tax=Streptomyces scopuliridis TaxID=452529 RepID=UPI0036999CF3
MVVAITAGLHGAGRFGKTTLAKYVAAHRTVQHITTPNGASSTPPASLSIVPVPQAPDA